MSGIDNFLSKQNQANYYLTPKSQPEEQAQSKVQTQTESSVAKDSTTGVDTVEIRNEFNKVKSENGLIRKFYNFLKNTTGVGLGSKKVEKEIDKLEKDEISKDEFDEKVKEYRASQKNGTQTLGNVAASAASISAFLTADKLLKKFRAQDKLDALPEIAKNIFKAFEFLPFSNMGTKIKKLLNSKTKATILLLPLLGFIGGSTKQMITTFDAFGSKEHTVNKKDFADKKDYKAAKKAAKKAKTKDSLKNFGTGALNGVLAPITTLVGGIVGVPAYIATTLGVKYATDKNDGNKKSFSDFAQKFKDNAVVNTLGALLIAIPAFKKVHYNKVLGENLDKVVKKLQGKALKLPDLPSTKTTYKELEGLMLESEPINKILNNHLGKTLDEVIKDLTDENIFAVKFLQIKNGYFYKFEHIVEALKENCPPTRTLEQAQEHINKLWGSTEYEVSKLLGVGTVAETYLAKDKSGKEVCIKVLKEGINAEKIAADKEKFLKLVIGDTPQDKLTESQKYLIKNIEDLANGIAQEVDFKNEMQAAEALRKHCKVTNVAKPIDVKDGIYIMEKAPGISVRTLADYINCEREIKICKRKISKGDELAERDLAKWEEKMKKIKSRAPEFDDFEMTPEQIKKLLKTYIDLQVEQFTKIDKNGKVIHADIHPGNIFIDLDSLKTGKGKLFTLIDTGNTINLSKEQAKAALQLTSMIKRANTKDLTATILDGAILPQGLTKEVAAQKIEADLKKYFFDSKTKIDTMDIDNFYKLSDNILRKYGIIPNNTQLNLNKAKTSAENSFKDLINSLFSKKFADIDDESSKIDKLGAIKTGIAYMTEIFGKLTASKKMQESKNLFQMSWKEALNFLRNPNNLKTNSEDFLTFEMKQNMPNPKPENLFGI